MIWALLGVLAFLILLLLIPVRVAAVWDGGLRVTVLWLFLRFQVFPQKEKPERTRPEKGKRPKPKKKKPEKPAKTGPPEELAHQMGLWIDLLSAVTGALGVLIRRFRLKIRLDMVVAKGDAARTAIAYGRLNAAVYGAYAAASNVLRLAPPDISIRPDFTAEKGAARLEAEGALSPMAALLAVAKGGARFLIRTLRRIGMERREAKETDYQSSTNKGENNHGK